MVDDGGFMLLDLALACSRLRLDSGDLVEAVLSGMDARFTEREAVTMTIVELLQRKGAYSGKLKAAVDSGVIFQMSSEGIGDVHEGQARSDEQRPLPVRPVGTSGRGTLRVRRDSRKRPS